MMRWASAPAKRSKNYVFKCAPTAILASLTSTCRRHDIDPQLYLTQLLVNLPGWPQRDLAAWLPDEWKRRRASLPAPPAVAATTRSGR